MAYETDIILRNIIHHLLTAKTLEEAIDAIEATVPADLFKSVQQSIEKAEHKAEKKV